MSMGRVADKERARSPRKLLLSYSITLRLSGYRASRDPHSAFSCSPPALPLPRIVFLRARSRRW